MDAPRWPFPSVTEPAWLRPPGAPDPYLQAARDAVLACARAPRENSSSEGTPAGRALTAARELTERLDWVLLSLVGEARGDGASWEAVGAALGVSKQAAHKRFAPYVALALEQAVAPTAGTNAPTPPATATDPGEDSASIE